MSFQWLAKTPAICTWVCVSISSGDVPGRCCVWMFKGSPFVSPNCFPERSRQFAAPSPAKFLSAQQQIKIITNSTKSPTPLQTGGWGQLPSFSRGWNWGRIRLKLATEATGSTGGALVKNPSASARDMGLIPGSGRSMEEEMATHSSFLAWRTPWTEEPGGLYSPWRHKASDMTEET